MGEITKIKIFPSIGIMRVGNSPEFFIGPEQPGVYDVPEGGFKDAQCRIKRQAARFRLYGYDEGNKPVELSAQDVGQIVWRVQLGNKKASWARIFAGTSELRNEWYSKDPAKREDLNIIASERQLIGANQKPVMFDDGKFIRFENGEFKKTEPVYLGEMWTDEAGRLLIVGGRGKSGGVVPQPAAEGYPLVKSTFNSPGWYDDIADGPVKATVTLKDGKTIIEAMPSWVISAPPDYAPQITNLATIYDFLRQAALNKTANNEWPPEVDTSWLNIPDPPSFKNDVAPILQRVLDLRWVNQDAAKGAQYPHGNLFTTASPPKSDFDSRQLIFNALRPPGKNPPTGSMPKLWGDNYPANEPPENVMTPTQYEIIKRWADDKWKNPDDGLPPAPAPFENPEDISRAALEACVGGALYPGIETGRRLRDIYKYIEPFRLDPNALTDGKPLEAGDMTKEMSLPWQADFFMCRDYEDIYAWWPAQRPDEVLRDAQSNALELWTDGITNSERVDLSPLDGRLQTVYDWHRFGFVTKEGDKFIETERCLVIPSIFLVLDRSHFSEHEVSKAPVSFDNCFYVVVEGFRPTDLKITNEQLTTAELEAIAPSITFKRADGTTATGMEAHAQALLLEIKPLNQSALQRLTFAYRVTFTDASEFAGAGEKQITLTATKPHPNDLTGQTVLTDTGEVTLFEQPNPYMLDGSVPWLSDDVRVFRVMESGSQFGIQFGPLKVDTAQAGATAAQAFIKKVVDKFNDDKINETTHPFASISKDQDESRLTLLEKIKGGGKMPKVERVFNFAVARVRYHSFAEATDVRVFFRLFTTAATGLDYNATTYPRRKDKPVPIIGKQAGTILTIPCYGDPRASSEDKQVPDELNRNTLLPTEKGETYCYFGCWLDFNQNVPQIPDPANPSEMTSIQSQIMGMHQCLVAEIYYPDDPIEEGATPAASDNLAQRNLIIDESDNPGSPATHTVQHTLDIKATQGVSQQAAAFAALFANSNGGQNSLAQPNELMIHWNNLPPGASVTLYLPDAEAEVMNLAKRNYEARRLERLNDGTIRCLPGDVTYVPLPTGRAENIAALMSVELPDSVRDGEAFDVLVQQITGRPRRVMGAFQLKIPVSNKTVLLGHEVGKLSVLRHIFRSIPVTNRWYPVFVRYLDQISERVRGFGGDPDKVVAAPDGSGVDPASQHCVRFGWLVSLVLALLVLVAGLHPAANYLPEIIVAVVLIIALVLWATKCKPSACRAITVGLVGLGLGAALLAVFLLAGFAAAHGLTVIALAALAFGTLAIAGLLSGCLSFAEKT